MTPLQRSFNIIFFLLITIPFEPSQPLTQKIAKDVDLITNGVCALVVYNNPGRILQFCKTGRGLVKKELQQRWPSDIDGEENSGQSDQQWLKEIFVKKHIETLLEQRKLVQSFTSNKGVPLSSYDITLYPGRFPLEIYADIILSSQFGKLESLVTVVRITFQLKTTLEPTSIAPRTSAVAPPPPVPPVPPGKSGSLARVVPLILPPAPTPTLSLPLKPSYLQVLQGLLFSLTSTNYVAPPPLPPLNSQSLLLQLTSFPHPPPLGSPTLLLQPTSLPSPPSPSFQITDLHIFSLIRTSDNVQNVLSSSIFMWIGGFVLFVAAAYLLLHWVFKFASRAFTNVQRGIQVCFEQVPGAFTSIQDCILRHVKIARKNAQKTFLDALACTKRYLKMASRAFKVILGTFRDAILWILRYLKKAFTYCRDLVHAAFSATKDCGKRYLKTVRKNVQKTFLDASAWTKRYLKMASRAFKKVILGTFRDVISWVIRSACKYCQHLEDWVPPRRGNGVPLKRGNVKRQIIADLMEPEPWRSITRKFLKFRKNRSSSLNLVLCSTWKIAMALF